MVVQLDTEYETEIVARGLKTREMDVFEHLLEHMRDRHLFLLASRAFYGYLLNEYKNTFSKSIIGVLQNVFSNATTILTEAKCINPLITLVSDESKKRTENGVCFVTISDLPAEFDYNAYLCCENLEDSKFYRNLYKLVQPQREDYATRIKFDSFGGGDKKAVLHWLSQRRICLVICDSDIKYPGCNSGGTANIMKKLFVQQNPLYAQLIVLTVHEKENLFPWDFLVKNSDENVQTVIEELVRLKKVNPDIQDYFDIKDGVFINAANSSNNPENWEAIYRPIIDFIKTKGIEHFKTQPTTRKLFAGIKSSGLANLMPDKINATLFWHALTQKQKADLETIFKAIYRFGFAYSEITS